MRTGSRLRRTASAPPKFVTGSMLRHILVLTGTGAAGLMAIFLTAIFAANHKAIFPTAALVAWCVLVYLCVDFGFFHKLFNLCPEDNAVYRAAGEASIAASLVIFLYTFLRLRLGHGLVRMLFGVWILAQLALIAVAVVGLSAAVLSAADIAASPAAGEAKPALASPPKRAALNMA